MWRCHIRLKHIRIQIDGKPFNVTKNIYEAILAFMPMGHCRIWVDEICIGQNNFEEKGTQVLRMSAIFSNESMVIAWLGSSCPEAEQIFEIVENYSEHGVDKLQSDQTAWASLKNFADFEYWSRTWIVQELLVASQLKIMSGAKTVNEAELSSGSNQLVAMLTLDDFWLR